MGYPTNIEWTDATWNPIGGCSIASPGCGPCWAQELAGTRLKHHPLYAGTTDIVKGRPIFNGTMTAAPADHPVWRWPMTWRGAKNPKLGPGMPSLIFVGDMSDLFHHNRPYQDIAQVLARTTLCSHVFQLLTKRADRMAELLACEEFLIEVGYAAAELVPLDSQCIDTHTPAGREGVGLAGNCWVGASAERQPEFDERWPHLRRLAQMGFIVFISYEPAMGPLVLPPDFLALGDRAWLIAGGCSGDRAWWAHPNWFRRVRDDCGSAGVPFFFKQWGEWVVKDNDDRNSVFQARDFVRVGKKAAGALLDGVMHRAFPRIAAQAIGAAA